jgi:beta-barrel assembly-enhancing protease
MQRTLRMIALFVALIGIVGFPALADRTNLTPAWNLFSPQQDIEMGRMFSNELEAALQLINNRNANTYIDAFGKQLSAHAPGYRFQYHFEIVNDNTINVWALPGGFIYVTSGLIEASTSEPQLAGALAHGIGHVALRHGTAEVSQAYNDGGINSTRAGVSVNDAMTDLNIRFEPGSLPLQYSLEEERQADIVAAQIMYDSGFDPRQLTQFFATVSNAPSNLTGDFFEDHPNFPNRAATIQAELQNLGGLPRNVRGDSEDFHAIKDRLLAINSSPPPSIYDRNTPEARPAQPSSRLAVFRGRDLEFQYPENWRVSEGSDSILIVPENGFVSSDLAYGMTIATFDPQNRGYFGGNSFTPPGTRIDNTTLANATDQLIEYLRQSNPNIRMVRTVGRIRVDGAEAMVVDFTNDSPVGGNETDWMVTVLRPNGLLRYFLGVAPELDFRSYRPVFERIVASVRFTD